MSKRKQGRSGKLGAESAPPRQRVPNQKLATQRRKLMQQHYRAKYKLG